MNSNQLKKLLLDNKLVTETNLAKAIKIQAEVGGSLSKILVQEGMINEVDLTMSLSEALGVPTLHLALMQVQPEVVGLIPKKIAYRYEVIPISKIGNVLTVAMSDPLNLFAIDDLKLLTGCFVNVVITGSKEIQAALDANYGEGKKLDEIIDEMGEDWDIELVGTAEEKKGAKKLERVEDAPMIKMVSLIIQQAIRQRASDIHFEIYEKRFRVRYRVDGICQEVFWPPREMHPSIVARIKILSELDIAEKRLPQDGRFKIRLEKREIDFRVSILPTSFGEKVVLRILDKGSIKVDLQKLGFLPETFETFKRVIQKPYGMILITGPTGSGKSTTLYSVLSILNTPDRNVMTIEDPVEYQIEGISQTQVNSEIGLTFAAGLRSLLRQNPDVILVGEIRDRDTADIAVKASLTGHLVFSTLHTNSACGAVTRLIDMGVEPFLIASSTVMVGAQRLCRRICENCKEPCEIPDEVIARLKVDKSVLKGVTAYRGKGCSNCRGTGYYGRMATMEILEVDEEIRKMIVARRPSDEIERVARSKGMKTLFENAIADFKMGATTLEEVLRITSEEEQ
ncbi:MAG: ATPase, T2SS/T4P/T4SS family [Candidatus Omnitrophica bacterium]|nr:ATPase, T2SS/T4P/T4SS family [Candidatus Omnitrophota bacterium]